MAVSPTYYTKDAQGNYVATSGAANTTTPNSQVSYYSGQPLPAPGTTPGVNITAPGKTTVKYPGTQAGQLWYQITRGDVAAAQTSEQRALANQQTQADAANAARNSFFDSSGYKDFVNKRVNLQPTFNQSMMDTTLGQQRDLLEGQTADAKRRLMESSGGNVPSGYMRSALQTADSAKAGQYARAASDLSVQKASQDRKDEVEAIGLAAQQAAMDYGANSDLAKALERIYAVTIAKTPEYNWDELKKITDAMAEQQQYSVENEYGYGAGGGEGEGGGEGGGGGGGGDGGGSYDPVTDTWTGIGDRGSFGGSQAYVNSQGQTISAADRKAIAQAKLYQDAQNRYKQNTGKELGTPGRQEQIALERAKQIQANLGRK